MSQRGAETRGYSMNYGMIEHDLEQLEVPKDDWYFEDSNDDPVASAILMHSGLALDGLTFGEWYQIMKKRYGQKVALRETQQQWKERSEYVTAYQQ